jgi:hypothetical protein
MKKRMLTFILFVSLITCVSAAQAFFPRGRINEAYSYDNLTLERTESGRCYLRGTIVNETDIRKEDVKITFYAMTIQDKTLWRLILKIDMIDKYGSYDFRKKVKRCKKEDPYKWEFKIKERKR